MPREEIPVDKWGTFQIKKWVECQGFINSERVTKALWENYCDGYVLMKGDIEDIIKTCSDGLIDIRERTRLREALKELRTDNRY
jgi:hypothetical protein